jgi:hypothetical protein
MVIATEAGYGGCDRDKYGRGHETIGSGVKNGFENTVNS